MRWLLAFVFLVPVALAQKTAGTIPLRHGPTGSTFILAGGQELRVIPPSAVEDDGSVETATVSVDASTTTMRSEWPDHRWVQHAVTTPRALGEDTPTQAARHGPAVVALQREFPSVPVAVGGELGHSSRAMTPPPSAPSIGRDDSVMHSSWKDVNNVTHTVTTPRQSSETVTAQATRHAAAVNALALTFKPVNPSTLVGRLLIFPTVTRLAA